jgi:tetratricopeptide (TPR) repeat protein
MRRARTVLAVTLVLFVASFAYPQPADLRKQFGTPSLEAAKQLAEAIRLSQGKKHKDALAAVNAAIKADPQFQMGYYWKGIILNNLGEIDDSMAAYKKALSDDVRRSRMISANTASNLALTCARLEKYDESNLWFTRAIFEDGQNASKQRGKAYRNMAITLSRQGKHMSAAVALLLAYQDKAANITPAMIREFLSKIGDEEVATVLYFGDKLPRVDKRGRDTSLTHLALAGGPSEAIADLLPSPQTGHVVAVPANAEHYYLLTTGAKGLGSTKVAAPAKIVSATVAEGHLYALTAAPSKIVKLDVATGKAMTTVALKNAPPRAASLAVMPTNGLAFFCADDLVYLVRLRDGAILKSDVPGQQVVLHPNQRDLYSSLKPDRRGGGGGSMVIINGRPVFLRRNFDWLQTTLFHSVITPSGLMIASVRENVASNANRLSVSPNGQWVAVAGGGGFRPRGIRPGSDGAGYGVGVFAASNFEHLQGFFKTDAYPLGVAFNPVTHQVVGVRAADAKVYHLGDTKTPAEVKGKFSGAACWSGNGRYLFLANQGGGVSAYENTLTKDELARGDWWKAIRVVRLQASGPRAPVASFEPVEAYRTFAATAPSLKELSELLNKAIRTGRTNQPGNWAEYPGYTKDEAHKRAALMAAALLAEKGDAGIAIFRVRGALKTHKGSVPLTFFLAEALRAGDQGETAEKHYVEVIQGDHGRTNLSIRAFNELARLLTARKQELSALRCLACSLYLDRANPETHTLAKPLLKKHKFDA